MCSCRVQVQGTAIGGAHVGAAHRGHLACPERSLLAGASKVRALRLRPCMWSACLCCCLLILCSETLELTMALLRQLGRRNRGCPESIAAHRDGGSQERGRNWGVQARTSLPQWWLKCHPGTYSNQVSTYLRFC